VRRRPQPNPRRGLLRAAVAVLILTAELLAIILIVSSVTAPPAKAPIVPATPGPIATPAAHPTSVKPARGTTPGPATPGHKKTLGFAPGRAPGGPTLLMTMGRQVFAQAMREQRGPRINEVAAPNGRQVVYFQQAGDAYSRNPLFLATAGVVSGPQVGYGDPLVRPAWSPDGRYLLYVRVSPTEAFPGARWSLVRLDTRSRRSHIVARMNGMNLTPLGWSRGRIVFLVANTTDTSVYQIVEGHVSFVSIVMPQPIITATLSPDGRYIAFGAPTNCVYCTVDVYDLDQLKAAIGPTGMPQESALAWTADGKLLVAQIDRSLAVVQPGGANTIARFPFPARAPRLWTHSMVARVSGRSLDLVDTITHQTYRSTR